MKMDRYAATVLTFLYLQSLCFATGAPLPMKNLVNAAGVSRSSNKHCKYDLCNTIACFLPKCNLQFSCISFKRKNSVCPQKENSNSLCVELQSHPFWAKLTSSSENLRYNSEFFPRICIPIEVLIRWDDDLIPWSFICYPAFRAE